MPYIDPRTVADIRRSRTTETPYELAQRHKLPVRIIYEILNGERYAQAEVQPNG